ncbi:MAG: hypothetical protein OES34_09400, partial [Nitrosopumilus sp.]|nr:hypothetical protein [Nitrosopumilus sp.]
TIIIIVAALAISFFLWSIGIYFFFLPIIFLPFLKFVKFKSRGHKTKICSVCELPSDGNYCSRCGTKLA